MPSWSFSNCIVKKIHFESLKKYFETLELFFETLEKYFQTFKM